MEECKVEEAVKRGGKDEKDGELEKGKVGGSWGERVREVEGEMRKWRIGERMSGRKVRRESERGGEKDEKIEKQREMEECKEGGEGSESRRKKEKVWISEHVV